MVPFAQEHGSTEEHHGSAHAANEIALFVGITHERRENAFALGLEYERRISRILGIGIGVEQTFGDLDFWVYTVPFTFHAERWKFVVAPGIEKSRGGSENLGRFALGYELDRPDLNVIPTFTIDFVDGEAVYIIGVSLGRGF
jgi:hypothetical protein